MSMTCNVERFGFQRRQAGQELDGCAIAAMKRMLATSGSRVRAYGGARFDAGRTPAPEWAEFGTYTFVLPRWDIAVSASAQVSVPA
jgi:hypothetical protein